MCWLATVYILFIFGYWMVPNTLEATEDGGH